MLRIKGLTVVESKETSNHEVRICKTVSGGRELFIEMIRALAVKQWGDFLPSKVYDENREYWTFDQEDFEGFGVLVNHRGELIIVLINKEKNIEKVIPVSDLPHYQKVLVDDQVEVLGGRDATALLMLKNELSKDLGFGIKLSVTEQLLLKLSRVMEEQEENERRIAREKARKERIERLMSRPHLNGYSEDRRSLSGIPATEEEWPLLEHATPVVLVESYDDESHLAGNPLEFFYVSNREGVADIKKHLPRAFYSERPKEAVSAEAKGAIFIYMEKKVRRVGVFSKEAIAELREKGLNGGALLALDKVDEEGRYPVVRLQGKECITVGHFVALDQ